MNGDYLDPTTFPVIGVASIKGGCGRSLLAGYLAIKLARELPTVPVYLVDLDLGTPGQFVLFGQPQHSEGAKTGSANLKASIGAAVRDQDWKDLLADTCNLRDLNGLGQALFDDLAPDKGLLRLVTGPGIAKADVVTYRQEVKGSNLVHPLRNSIRATAVTGAIIILDLDAGLDGETPEVFRNCDAGVLTVRPDRQHREILADPVIRAELLLKDDKRFLSRFKLIFNFVPAEMDEEELLDQNLRELGYEGVLLRPCGRLDADILRNELFVWPMPEALKGTVDALAEALFELPGGDE